MKLKTGTIVSYTPRTDGGSYPAVVMNDWGDGNVALYVLHFEQAHFVRAALRAQLEVAVDIDAIGKLTERVAYLERALMRLTLQSVDTAADSPDSPDAPNVPDAPDAPDAPDEQPTQPPFANEPPPGIDPPAPNELTMAAPGNPRRRAQWGTAK